MRERTENDLSARISRLAAVEPRPQARDRVLAAMAAAATMNQTGGARPASTPPNAPVGQSGLAVAAGVAAVAMLAVLLMVGGMSAGRAPDRNVLVEWAGDGFDSGPTGVADTATAAPAEGVGGAATGAPTVESVVSLIEASWLLERALDELPAQRRLMRAGTASTIAALETQIAMIDEQLNSEPVADTAPRVQATLWRDRVDAMNALYQVRYSQSQLFAY